MYPLLCYHTLSFPLFLTSHYLIYFLLLLLVSSPLIFHLPPSPHLSSRPPSTRSSPAAACKEISSVLLLDWLLHVGGPSLAARRPVG